MISADKIRAAINTAAEALGDQDRMGPVTFQFAQTILIVDALHSVSGVVDLSAEKLEQIRWLIDSGACRCR